MRFLSHLFPVVMLTFVAIAVVQFSLAWAGAERGILLYEQTCPLADHRTR
jgi:hypothetical protein